jgi:O-antigen/teichoic acid export membrane protein
MSIRLARDVFRYVPALGVPILAGTLSTIVFARLTSASQLGTFLLVVALSASLANPCSQWLRQAVLRFYPAHARDGSQAGYVRAVTILAMLSGLAATVVVVGLLVGGTGGGEFQTLYLVPAALITFFSVVSTCRTAILQAAFAVGWYSSLASAFAAGRLVVPLLLFPVLGGVAALLWGTAIVSCAQWVAVTMATWRHTRSHGRQRARAPGVVTIFREAFGFGAPLTVSDVGTQILDYSDRYMLAALIGPVAVGLYSPNYSIAEKLILLAQGPLIYAAHSQIVAQWESGDQLATQRLIRTATRWLVLLGAPMVAFTVVRSAMISALLLGDAYVEGHQVIPIVAAAILVAACTQYGHKTFELAKDTLVMSGALLAAAFVNLVAVIGLTVALGYLGGAIATAIGYGTYAILIFVLSRRRGAFRWDVPWRTVLNSHLAALAAAAFWAAFVPDRVTSLWTMLQLLLAGAVGVCLYMMIVGILGELPLGAAVRLVGTSLSQVRRRNAPAPGND